MLPIVAFNYYPITLAEPTGVICLTNELFPFRHKVKTWDIGDFFAEEYFETKKVIYLPL